VSIDGVLAKLVSECGLISFLLTIAIVWLAMQLAKERAGRESDRAAALDALKGQMDIVQNLAIGERKLRNLRAKISD
jgi:hypothetical protein